MSVVRFWDSTGRFVLRARPPSRWCVRYVAVWLCVGGLLSSCSHEPVHLPPAASCNKELTDAGADAGADDDAQGCRVIALAAGTLHTCAVLASGNLRCWGTGHFGQLGYRDLLTIGDDEAAGFAGNVEVGGAVRQVAADFWQTCAVLRTGAVRCWGDLALGPMGEFGFVNQELEPPSSARAVPLESSATQVTIGAQTCALLTTGAVRCWDGVSATMHSDPADGLFSDDQTSGSPSSDMALGGPAMQVHSHGNHTCALLTTGSVRCWGDATWGQLGYGSTEDVRDNSALAEVGDVDIGDSVQQISLGAAHTCVLTTRGTVRCWGVNDVGQTGTHTTDNIGDDELPSSVGEVELGGTVREISAGGAHTCALLTSGAVRCWGQGDYGALGYGNTEDIGDDETPASAGDVDVGGTVEHLAAGDRHTCALLSSGEVRCWGTGVDGQLGYGNVNSIGDNETPASAGDVPVIGRR